MTDTATIQLHRSASGQWVRCTASVRSCPRGQHVTVAGDAADAAQFFAEVGVQADKAAEPKYVDLDDDNLATWRPSLERADVQRARETFDIRARSLASYTLPAGKNYRTLTQEQRYAQSVTNIALNLLADRGAGQPFNEETVNLAKLTRDLTTEASRFAGVGAGDQEATRVSLANTLAIVEQYAHNETTFGSTQRVVSVRPLLRRLETKFLVADTQYAPTGGQANAATSSLGSKSLTEAQASFAERSRNLVTYELPQGFAEPTSLASSDAQIDAQSVTRAAAATLLSKRVRVPDSEAYVVSYPELRKAMNSQFAFLQQIGNESAAASESLRRVDAIFRREASSQQIGNNRGAFTDVRDALKALEEKALTADLNSPLPQELSPLPVRPNDERRFKVS